jgi:hypothetical protein
MKLIVYINLVRDLIHEEKIRIKKEYDQIIKLFISNRINNFKFKNYVEFIF